MPGKLFLPVIAAACVGLVACSGDEPEAQGALVEGPGYETQIHGPIELSSELTVEVHLQVACLDPDTYSRPHASHWMAIPAMFDRSECQLTYIRQMAVHMNEMVIPIRVGAFSDLLSFEGFIVEVGSNDVGLTMTLTGSGSGLGPYTAKYQFEDGILIQRYVTSRAFEDEAYSLTYYGVPRTT